VLGPIDRYDPRTGRRNAAIDIGEGVDVTLPRRRVGGSAADLVKPLSTMHFEVDAAVDGRAASRRAPTRGDKPETHDDDKRSFPT